MCADVYVLLFAVLLVYRPIKYLSRPFNKGFLLLVNACLHIAYIHGIITASIRPFSFYV